METREEEEEEERKDRRGGKDGEGAGSYIKSDVQFLSRHKVNGFSRFPELPANLACNQLISTIGYRKNHYLHSFSDETKKLSTSIHNLVNTTQGLSTCISPHYHELVVREDCH